MRPVRAGLSGVLSARWLAHSPSKAWSSCARAFTAQAPSPRTRSSSSLPSRQIMTDPKALAWWTGRTPTPPPEDGKGPDLSFRSFDEQTLKEIEDRNAQKPQQKIGNIRSPSPKQRSSDGQPTDGESSGSSHAIQDIQHSQTSSEELLTRRIHLLGIGSIGTLVAHSLAILPNPPPMTILMHRPEMLDDFNKADRIVRLINKATDVNSEAVNFDADVLEPSNSEGVPPFWRREEYYNHKTRKPANPLTEAETMPSGEAFIYTLIVTVKGPATVNALRSVRHRLDARSTVLLMQNGMGQIDELKTKVFPDPATRPTFMLGIISHGCYMRGPFAVIHAGFGAVALGIHRDTDKFPLPPSRITSASDPSLSAEEKQKYFPSDKDLYGPISSRYLLRTLTRSPVLACAAYPAVSLFQLQLEKLVSNCILNPLTALFNVQNGIMLETAPLIPVQRLLLSEISLVIRGMPELESVPNARLRFSPTRLEGLFRGIAKKTAANSSSMREDIKHVRQTEIDYINGYIVKRGEEQGIRCVLNYMICQMVKGRRHIDQEAGVTFKPYGIGDTREYNAVAGNHDRRPADEQPVMLEETGTPQG